MTATAIEPWKCHVCGADGFHADECLVLVCERLQSERDDLSERFVDMNRQAVEAVEELHAIAKQRDELLEALETFVAEHEADGCEGAVHWCGRCVAAHAAIAKATGK
jgi:hypothetical protein